MTRTAELGVQLVEALRDDEGGRPATLAILSAACQWSVRIRA